MGIVVELKVQGMTVVLTADNNMYQLIFARYGDKVNCKLVAPNGAGFVVHEFTLHNNEVQKLSYMLNNLIDNSLARD